MKIIIDADNTTSVFPQLIVQIKQAVLKGNIRPGDQLPSIRQLANDLNINNKTVARAYRLLERDGVIESKGFKGSFITENAIERSAIDLNSWVKKELGKNIKAFRNAGVTDSEIRRAFAEELD